MERSPYCKIVFYYDSDDIIYMEPEESSFDLFSTVCYSLIFCLSVLGNSFLLWVLLRKRETKSTSDLLLLHLTASDLCFTVTLPVWAYQHLHGWIFGDWACKIISGIYFLGIYSYMLFLTAITLDRYVAVVHAVSTSAQARRRFYAILASTGIWLVCAATSIKDTVNTETKFSFDGEIRCEEASQSLAMNLFSIYFHISLFFLIPFIIITFCYVRMWMTIRHCRMRGRNQALGLLLGIVLGFFICWAPYNVVLFLASLEELHVQSVSTDEWEDVMLYGYYISHTLAYCHCCLNPLFHVFGGERFRRHLLMPCSTRRQSITSSSRPPPSVSLQTYV
uniref:Chemokine XC receptor 1-like n=1 Tax=Myripristis murdjan TaxID=586833 RepID=A0A667Y5Y9_9TELE